LEIISFDEPQELPNLVWFGFAVDFLEIDLLGRSSPAINVVASTDSEQPESKCLHKPLDLGEAQVRRAGQSFSENLSYLHRVAP
jgi:hypothetical protein